MTSTATISFTLDQETFEDILETAGYACSTWAKGLSVAGKLCSVAPIDDPDIQLFCLEHMEDLLVKAAAGLLNDEAPGLCRPAQSLVFGDDAGNIDGTAADQLIQLCCFGEIVYG